MNICILEHGPDLNRIALSGTSYAEKIRSLEDQNYWWSGGYRKELIACGHQVEQVYPLCEQLADVYQAENDTRSSGDGLLSHLFEKNKPDCVIIHVDDYLVSRRKMRWLREQVGRHCRLVGYYGTFSPGIVRSLKYLDALLVPCRWMRDHYRGLGLRSERLRHAYNPESAADTATEKRYDLSLIGHLYDIENFWSYRKEVIQRLLADGVDLQVWGRVQRNASEHRRAKRCYFFNQVLSGMGVNQAMREKIPFVRWAAGWEASPGNNQELLDQYPARFHDPIHGDRYREVLHGSLATLNVHADIARGESVNLRLFEASGEGVPVVSDWSSDLGGLFEEDTEIVSYRSPEEASEKAKFLIENPAIAAEIGKKARNRVLKQHTYKHRTQELLGYLDSICDRN